MTSAYMTAEKNKVSMDIIEQYMKQHPGRTREQAIMDLTREPIDLRKTIEDAVAAAFSERVVGMIQNLQAENPALSYSEAFTQVQKLAPEIFTDWISMN